MVTTDKVTVAEFSPHIGKTTTDYKENDMGVKWENFKWSNINYTVPTNKVLTDILCPNCGKPIYMRTDMILTSNPAQYQYECYCGWVGYSHNKWQKGLGE